MTNIGNSVTGAKIEEGAKVEYIGKGDLNGMIGHVFKVGEWFEDGPQICEVISEEHGVVNVVLCRNLRRIHRPRQWS